jgi:hypothetical protein
MQEPFPALEHLKLEALYEGYSLPVLSDGLFGGSSPHLQSLELRSISFPALPKLLLSASDLVDLTLWEIPDSGYFSPETLVSCLAVLVNLKSLTIRFQSSLSERRHLPPPIRTVLSALTYFEFQGATVYLEDLVAGIDAPLLDSVCISFRSEDDIDISQFGEFMRRTKRFQLLNEAHVKLDYGWVLVTSLPPTQTVDEKSGFRISSEYPPWVFSSLIQTLTSFFSSICIVEHLYIYGPDDVLYGWEGIVVQWLEIFLPFIAVKNLYLSKGVAEFISPDLQELVGESVKIVLPALERIFLEEVEPSGPDEDAIGQFVAARQLLGHTVAVSHWNYVRTS